MRLKSVVFGGLLYTLLYALTTQAQLPANYQSLSAQQKRDLLWKEISEKPYAQLPSLDDGPAPGGKELFGSGIHNAFTSPSDEMAEGRKKIIHKWGSTVLVRFSPINSNTFTGIFHQGALGLARMSLALPYAPGKDFVPGLAVKFFVDGQPSKNIFVMEKLEGQGANTNYFQAPFTNVLPPPTSVSTKFGTWAFERYVENAIHLKVDHVAAMYADGVPAVSPLAPTQIFLVPAKEVATATSAADFRLELAKIPTGTVLYEVFGTASAEPDAEIIKIGELKTESDFVASLYQDEKLYFQHAGTEVKSAWVRWWPF